MLKEDEKLMKEYLERISYYHLPKSAHSETYIRLIKG
jgi:abortive infection bacteriophage resistance protein